MLKKIWFKKKKSELELRARDIFMLIIIFIVLAVLLFKYNNYLNIKIQKRHFNQERLVN